MKHNRMVSNRSFEQMHGPTIFTHQRISGVYASKNSVYLGLNRDVVRVFSMPGRGVGDVSSVVARDFIPGTVVIHAKWAVAEFQNGSHRTRLRLWLENEGTLTITFRNTSGVNCSFVDDLPRTEQEPWLLVLEDGELD